MGTRDIAIACQGGGSHAAYTAGVLPVLLEEFDNLALARAGHGAAYREAGTEAAEAPVLAAMSGTSGGAISALLAWYGFITGGATEARRRHRSAAAPRPLLGQQFGDALDRGQRQPPGARSATCRRCGDWT